MPCFYNCSLDFGQLTAFFVVDVCTFLETAFAFRTRRASLWKVILSLFGFAGVREVLNAGHEDAYTSLLLMCTATQQALGIATLNVAANCFLMKRRLSVLLTPAQSSVVPIHRGG